MNDTYEHLKYCAARFVYPIRKQKTPKSLEELESDYPRYARVKTWEKWWEQKFNDNYKSYIKKRMINHGQA